MAAVWFINDTSPYTSPYARGYVEGYKDAMKKYKMNMKLKTNLMILRMKNIYKNKKYQKIKYQMNLKI